MAQTSVELEPMLPWFLLTRDDTLTAESGQGEVMVPDGFLREGAQGGLYRYDDTLDNPWVPMIKESYESLKKAGYGQGIPGRYAIFGEEIHLFPIPQDACTFRMVFFVSGGSLEKETALNPWLVHAPEVLILETCARVDPARSGMWMGLAEKERNKLRQNEDQRAWDALETRIMVE